MANMQSQSFESHDHSSGTSHSNHDMPLRHRKSRLVTFVLSMLPGLNYMYLGLMKRGLFFMTLFFMLTFFVRETRVGALSFTVFMLICFCLFDAFRIRRLLRDGFSVPDNIDDVIAFYKNNKKLVWILGAILVVFSVLRRSRVFVMSVVLRNVAFSSFLGALLSVASLALWLGAIVLVCYIIAKIASKNGRDDN